MSVPFTQFLRPDGRERRVEIDRPDEVERMARDFIAAGGHYECEELMSGHAHFTAVHLIEGEEQDVVTAICPNGPKVPDAVDDLIRRSIDWLRENMREPPIKYE
jgi:hypothetical protein